MNILITAATSAQAYRLKNQLQHNNIVMGDHLDLPDFMLKPGVLIRLPDPKSSSYTHEMLALSLDLSVERVYLFRDVEIELLKQAETLFNEYNIELHVVTNEI